MVLQDDISALGKFLDEMLDGQASEIGVQLADVILELCALEPPKTYLGLPLVLFSVALSVHGQPNGAESFSNRAASRVLAEFYSGWVGCLSDSRFSNLLEALQIAADRISSVDKPVFEAFQLLHYSNSKAPLKLSSLPLFRSTSSAFLADQVIDPLFDFAVDMGLKSRHFISTPSITPSIFQKLDGDFDDSVLCLRLGARGSQRSFLVQGNGIAFVVNYNNLHFATILLDAVAREVYYADSLMQNLKPFAPIWERQVARALQFCQAQAKYCQANNLPFHPAYLSCCSWRLHRNRVKQQAVGSNDCAIFALMFALEFVSMMSSAYDFFVYI